MWPEVSTVLLSFCVIQFPREPVQWLAESLPIYTASIAPCLKRKLQHGEMRKFNKFYMNKEAGPSGRAV